MQGKIKKEILYESICFRSSVSNSMSKSHACQIRANFCFVYSVPSMRNFTNQVPAFSCMTMSYKDSYDTVVYTVLAKENETFDT